MKRRLFRCCGYPPGPLAPEDQAVVDAFRAQLDARRNPQREQGGRLGVLEFGVGSSRPPCGVSVFSAGLPRLSRPR